VQERYNWTWDDAEHTKVVVGLPNADMEHPAQHVIADKVVDLIAEIRTTLNFFLDSDPAAEQAPTRVVLTGAGSLLGGLPELMTEELGVPTQRLQVLSGLRKARGLDLDDSQEASLTIAAGLCMGGVR
jgi:type IV pilus assembly protein PilM